MHAWNLKPARDYGLTPAERRLSVRRESGLGDSLMHFTWLGFARTFLVCWNRLAIIGRENLPEHPRFVMAANHTSHLDAPVLASALPMQWRDHASPIAAGDVFFEKRHLAAFAALMVNALPVWRRNALAAGHAMEALRGQIVAGPAIYILFPEGSRSRDGRIHAFKSGIGALVAGTDVPVLPCHITGAAAAAPIGAQFPRRHKITLRIGRSLLFQSVRDNRAGWDEIAAVTQNAVAGLAASDCGLTPPPRKP